MIYRIETVQLFRVGRCQCLVVEHLGIKEQHPIGSEFSMEYLRCLEVAASRQQCDRLEAA